MTVSKSPTENPTLLLMLDGDPSLQKLIATWPNAYRHGAKKKDQIAAWAALTGFREVEVEAKWRTLFENGFLSRDGSVDEYTDRYLRGVALARMPRTALRRGEKKGETS